MRKNILRVACAVICLAPALSPAQNLSEQKIEFGKTSLNIQQIVNTLDNYLDVNAPKNFNWNYSIDLPSETMKLNKLIEVMIRSPIKQKPNTPVCLVFEDPVKACFHLALENQLNK